MPRLFFSCVSLVLLLAGPSLRAYQDEPSVMGKPLSHWVKALKGPNPSVRTEAARALQQLGPKAAPPLVEGLKSDDAKGSIDKPNDDVPEKYRPTAQKGLDWLVKQQNKDGSWAAAGGLYAARAAGIPVPRTALVDQQQADGSWGGGNTGVGPVFTTALNLIVLQLDKGHIPLPKR
jgi:hypothetical protein